MPNLWLWMFIYFAVANVTAYFLMYKDKQHAIKQQWRIAEYLFWLLCLVGGFIGVHLGMQHFQHKTTRLAFKSAVCFAGILWIVLVPLSFLILNH